MVTTYSVNPGQSISLAIVIKDGYGTLFDGYENPTIAKIIYPDGSLAANFPANMDKVNDGVYTYKFTLPNSIVGTYIAIANWPDPQTSRIQAEVFAINVMLPLGSFIVPG